MFSSLGREVALRDAENDEVGDASLGRLSSAFTNQTNRSIPIFSTATERKLPCPIRKIRWLPIFYHISRLRRERLCPNRFRDQPPFGVFRAFLTFAYCFFTTKARRTRRFIIGSDDEFHYFIDIPSLGSSWLRGVRSWIARHRQTARLSQVRHPATVPPYRTRLLEKVACLTVSS